MQLIDASRDRHLWAETYDEELSAENIFAIQSDLAQRIAASLRVTLAPQLVDRIRERPTESLEAYDAFVRGRSIYNDRGLYGESLGEVRAYFRAAIEADPSFAAPWAGMAAMELMALRAGRLPESEARPRVWRPSSIPARRRR